MNGRTFGKIAKQAFTIMVMTYATVVGNVDQDVMVQIITELCSEFTSGIADDGNFPSKVPFIKVIHATLINTFYHRDLDLQTTIRDQSTVRELLPKWTEVFNHLFTRFFSRYYFLSAFQFWDFLTPTITKHELIDLIDYYVTVSEANKKPMFVSLYPEVVRRRLAKGCVFTKGRVPRGIQPVGSGDDATCDHFFFHVCPYCNECDENSRKDILLDHMEKSHNVYRSDERSVAMYNSFTHHMAKPRHVIVRMINNQRDLLNGYNLHLHSAKDSIAKLRGEVVQPPSLLTKLDDNPAIDQSKMVETLFLERGLLQGRDWVQDIRRESDLAWAEANHLGY